MMLASVAPCMRRLARGLRRRQGAIAFRDRQSGGNEMESKVALRAVFFAPVLFGLLAGSLPLLLPLLLCRSLAGQRTDLSLR